MHTRTALLGLAAANAIWMGALAGGNTAAAQPAERMTVKQGRSAIVHRYLEPELKRGYSGSYHIRYCRQGTHQRRVACGVTEREVIIENMPADYGQHFTEASHRLVAYRAADGHIRVISSLFGLVIR